MRHSLKGLSLGLVPEWHTQPRTHTHSHTTIIPPARFLYRLEPLINQSVFMLCLSTMAAAATKAHKEPRIMNKAKKETWRNNCFSSVAAPFLPLLDASASAASFDECPQANLNPNTEYGIL